MAQKARTRQENRAMTSSSCTTREVIHVAQQCMAQPNPEMQNSKEETAKALKPKRGKVGAKGTDLVKQVPGAKAIGGRHSHAQEALIGWADPHSFVSGFHIQRKASKPASVHPQWKALTHVIHRRQSKSLWDNTRRIRPADCRVNDKAWLFARSADDGHLANGKLRAKARLGRGQRIPPQKANPCPAPPPPGLSTSLGRPLHCSNCHGKWQSPEQKGGQRGTSTLDKGMSASTSKPVGTPNSRQGKSVVSRSEARAETSCKA